ncbi:CDP-alcohol phosphatidyltransferase family protein [Pseudoroseicyclus aestuarii]|uniref:Phosphatidylglycerophosphate synthase n=1 Tax=Pseudoroseicyclus aestuarii TaxID=1795041 RepID=A0A318SSK7_9RHOB|nr:CDP-alcohol phosphatidyltransferase family protein [Pseudoroseicyclus aestuarii]PYE84810.1 phosphatidylglycerophosphate synthase [Pseudoroseicyclus aestuarii]
MLDAQARRLIDPPLNRMGRALARAGATADGVTLAGLVLGLLAALLVALGAAQWALLPLAASRLADGLDGAVARATRRSDYGGYLDIACDFAFYGALPLAFVLADPATNGAAGAFILASFYFNGTTFLGYAILAERRGIETAAQGIKSLYFSNGLLEGTETIAFFVLICLWPGGFAPCAWVFGALCYLSGALRLIGARRVFR